MLCNLPTHSMVWEMISSARSAAFQISPCFSLSVPSTGGRGGLALILSSGPLNQAEFHRTGLRNISDGLYLTFHKLPLSSLCHTAGFSCSSLLMRTSLSPFSFEGFLKHLYFISNHVLFLNNFDTAQMHSTAEQFFPSVTLL